MNAAIKIEDLSVVIKSKTILSDISVEVPAGKIMGLLGPSGAGKTTLIRTILGLQKSTKGQVKVLGSKAGTEKLHSQVGYVTQSQSVYSDLTVQENIRYFASLLGVNRATIKTVLEEVELDGHEKQLVESLSGGQRARVSLAIALLGSPRLLVLDEPTVGLDPVLREKIWDIFDNLSRQGVTLLVSSHVMDEADRCHELMFIRNGKLLTSGAKREILHETNATSMEAAFLKLATRQSDEF